jgi:hypothetical protein
MIIAPTCPMKAARVNAGATEAEDAGRSAHRARHDGDGDGHVALVNWEPIARKARLRKRKHKRMF